MTQPGAAATMPRVAIYVHLDNTLLDAARAACVAAPGAGLPAALQRLRSRGWAFVAPLSIVACIGAIAFWSAGATALAWTALVLVPPGCALALGWAAHGARPWLAVLAVPLFAVAVAAPTAPVGEVARIALMAGSCVTAGRLLAGVAPLPLLEAGVVAMAAVDATFLLGHLSEQQNHAFGAAVAAPSLPKLHIARLGDASCDFGDFFAAGLVGAILARRGSPQVVAAVATFLVTQAFNQLFFVVDALPQTVPPAVVMLAFLVFDARRPASAGRAAHVRQHREHAPVLGRRRREPELVEDARHVLLDGRLGHEQVVGDADV
jgi:hypothetical protein